ncbi:MAG TPA: ZIP family metal transporter [Candidatus Dormibacteraeota bacterium]|nr:ZIP family metal transporter [Candidatus Dormibacteraeota bacterium]
MILALLFSGLTFFSTLAGGVAAMRWPGRVQSLAALAGGVVLGAAFFDLLPEALERAQGLRLALQVPLGTALAGYLTFYALETFFHHHHGQPGCPCGMVGALGFVVHSLFDGMAIGLGFRLNPGVGLLVAAAVIGHDFSDGLNTVSYMITHHEATPRSWLVLTADAAAPLVGSLIAFVTPLPPVIFPLALGFFAGVFVYVASTSLLPRALELAVVRSLSLTLVGAAAMFLITRLV